MKWIDAKKRKPMHEDIVVVAMWRPQLHDYMYFIAIWDIRQNCWREHGEGEDMVRNCGYQILWWANITEPKMPNVCSSTENRKK